MEFLTRTRTTECLVQSANPLRCLSKKLIGVGEFLARKAKEDRHANEIQEAREAENEFLSSIGSDIEAEDEENELDVGSDDIEFFYLDSDKVETFEIYKLTRLYQTAADNLDPTLIQMLCKERNREKKKKEKLNLEEVLTELALVHYGVWKENEKTRKRNETKTEGE